MYPFLGSSIENSVYDALKALKKVRLEELEKIYNDIPEEAVGLLMLKTKLNIDIILLRAEINFLSKRKPTYFGPY